MSLKKFASTEVASISADATVQEAAKVMRDSHVGDVVVAEERNGKAFPVGILTDRDIVLATTVYDLMPSSVLVGDVMGPGLVTAKTTDSFYHVLNVMKEHGIRRIPLVHEDGSLVGIISSNDVIALLASELTDIVRGQERQHEVETDRRKKLA